MFLVNLFIFITAWLGAAAYTLLAIFDPSLPYSVNIFWSLIIILDAIGLLLIWLWYERYPKTIQLRSGILVALVIVVFYWGFATVHSFLSLNLDSLQVKWLGFVYIWEVVIVGAMVTFFVLRVTRFADRFLKDGELRKDSLQYIYTRIATTPLRACMIYMATVLFGYAIGSLQLWYFADLPLIEVTKNILSGMVVGILSSFALFFILERIVEPALRKSGEALAQSQDKEHTRFSLFTKIYAVSGLLVLVSVGFLGTVSYGGGQTLLEEQLKRSLSDRLAFIARELASDYTLPGKEKVIYYLGLRGSLDVLLRTDEKSNFSLPNSALSQEAQAIIFANAGKAISFIDRGGVAKVVSILPLDSIHSLLAVSYVSDFSSDLNLFAFYHLLVLFMILLAIAIIGTLFARSITLPIKEIQEGGVRIGQGDFSQYINVHTNDELEDLSDALNEAAAKLKVSYHYLEAIIMQRTQQLAKANGRQQDQIQELGKRDVALRGANESLRALDQAKTQFVSVAAHQLRTPLSVSKWTFQMLLSGDFGPLTKEQSEVLKRGNEMNEQMIDLVSDLLDVARIESGKLDYTFKAVDLGEFLPDIQNLFIQKLKEKQVTLNLQIPPKGSVFIKADEVRLRMVFQNIIDNALKFTSPGGAIHVTHKPKGDMYEFEVTDNGIGISVEELPRLFTKFFRARNAVQMDTRGTGLGLYIVASIIRTHGGTINVVSKIGKGTAVSFTLPLAKA